MKTLLISPAFILCVSTAWGQEKIAGELTSGRITYEEKVKLEIKLEGDAAQYADMLPKERKSEKLLLFTENATLYEESKSTGSDMPMQHGEGMMIRMVGSGENKIFTDLTTGRVTEQRDFMNRIFIVERGLPETKWKITGNQKVILGYQCMEAFSIDSAGAKFIVWFAPSFGVKGGPAMLNNLPGMVLEADINGGSRTYMAVAVESVPPEALKMEKPKDGKKVTEEEYNAIVEEKMKEMGVEEGGHGGGGTQMRIVIRK